MSLHASRRKTPAGAFVADDDQHARPVSPYEEEIKACIGRANLRLSED
jgi:hypothetical protein